MSVEENKAIARRHFEDLWNKGDLAVADEIYAATAVGHNPITPEHGGYPDCEKEAVLRDRTGFPDEHVTIEEQIAERDLVVTRWTSRGTHTGELMGLPPTGKQVTTTGIHIHRIIDGKIVEIWAMPDNLGFLQQLGVIPPLGQAG